MSDRMFCEYEFIHPGNIFSVHSWLLGPFFTALPPPPWCLCLNRDACHEATWIPLWETPKQNWIHNSKNIYIQFMTNCQAKLLTDSKSSLEIVRYFLSFFPLSFTLQLLGLNVKYWIKGICISFGKMEIHGKILNWIVSIVPTWE